MIMYAILVCLTLCDTKTIVSRPVRIVRVVDFNIHGMQLTNCTTRKPLFHDPYESYESYGSWTCIYTPIPSNVCSSQTVRLVSHCFTTRTSRTGRGLVYKPQLPVMICSSQTVRLVSHCFTTRTSRTSRTGRGLAYTPQVPLMYAVHKLYDS